MLEAFEWNVPADQQHWQRLQRQLSALKATGVDNLWLPPGCKASSPDCNGYDIYDLYDLGEFDQKGGWSTKWGSKEELIALSIKAKEVGVGLYWDAVLNHKAAADNVEKCTVVEVDRDDRTQCISNPYEISAWVGFEFPGRGEKYSKQKYHGCHFSGTDFNNENHQTAIYRILGDYGKGGANRGDAGSENGVYDYLMFADLDYNHPEVVNDVLNWGVWIGSQINLQGMRVDAVKHFSEAFLREFIAKIDEAYGEGWFFVGEFWDGLDDLHNYLARMDHKFSLFDAPLVKKFGQISKSNGGDLRNIFDDTLVGTKPINAVTLVMNHDTQPFQTLDTVIEPFFKPLAYALILLRRDGYPCLFYGDLYGIDPEAKKQYFPPSCGGALPDMALARKLYAYGEQRDYFDFPTCIGWVRYGTWDRPYGCAVVMSNAGPGWKRMHVGEMHAGEQWTDVLDWQKGSVTIEHDGFATFHCQGLSVSIWVNSRADRRDAFGKL